ncbi:hypothetical protein SSX86_008989 [Deinandra increscens subsp. villosa]|uniref:Uncharacterized protein n=1 Tax=Deinandra increscens subsp. villosa TaxID=3103831 RepID=A0AAP0H7C2_9ASTR
MKEISFSSAEKQLSTKCFQSMILLPHSSRMVVLMTTTSRKTHVLLQKELEVVLIIADYCMPQMTGFGLFRKIKDEWLISIIIEIEVWETGPKEKNRTLRLMDEDFKTGDEGADINREAYDVEVNTYSMCEDVTRRVFKW